MAQALQQIAAIAWSVAAISVIAVTLQGCGGDVPHTTLTTTLACEIGRIPWPNEGCQTIEELSEEADTFLRSHMPPWDVDNAQTLEEGILGPTLNVSLTARDLLPWAENIPKDIWLNYVLPYANVNEPRVDWRTLLSSELRPLVQNPTYQANTTSDVVSVLNEKLWSTLRTPEITFKSGQTPLIYDPMSTIDYGYASCTGISIMLVDALRSVGVPARIAGTPAWSANVSKGNHNWVEVWLGPGEGLDGGAWTFIEGKPAGGGETLTNPCDKWFCNPSHFDGKTQAFAPQFDNTTNTTIYPMAWDLENENVPGVNRTAFYNAVCKPCGNNTVTIQV